MPDKRSQTGIAAAGVTRSVRFVSRNYLASQHLWSALHNARLCTELEAEHAGNVPLDIEHRTTAINAVLSSMAFLESLVNEVFQDAADSPKMYRVNPRIEQLPSQCRKLMREFWREKSYPTRHMATLDRYQIVLVFANKPKLARGENPYQDASLLNGLRNKLVHFKPEWHVEGDVQKIKNKIANKFNPNPSTARGSGPWFPDKCLGAGCANWACTTSRNLADEWTDRLDLPRSYESDLNSYPVP